MPTTDPTYGWPVPEDTDPLKDGAAAMRELAAAIADTIGVQHYEAERSAGLDHTSETARDMHYDLPTTAVPDGWTRHTDAPYGVTVPAGVYLVAATVAWEGNASGRRLLVVREDGGKFTAARSGPPGSIDTFSQQAVLTATVTDTARFQVQTLQASGGNLEALAGETRWSVTRIGGPA